MSITLTNGTVLPDFPSEMFAEKSYGVLLSGTSTIMYVTSEKMYHIPTSLSTDGTECLYISSMLDMWALSDDTWTLVSSGSDYTTGHEYSLGSAEILWSNYDVLTVTAKNDDGTFTVGTEVYFANSEATEDTGDTETSEPFILPDGTELPALPEGIFETYPYGVIFKVIQADDGAVSYGLTAAYTERVYVAASISSFSFDCIVSKEFGYISYFYELGSDGWTGPSGQEDDGDILPCEDSAVDYMGAECYILWTNHDILTATAKNDDGTFTIGSELYHKSDVNYRIYGGWLNSMANQARRLGSVTGGMNPSEMETVFKSVGLAANERIYQVGGGESTLNASNLVFETSAVGALSE